MVWIKFNSPPLSSFQVHGRGGGDGGRRRRAERWCFWFSLGTIFLSFFSVHSGRSRSNPCKCDVAKTRGATAWHASRSWKCRRRKACQQGDQRESKRDFIRAFCLSGVHSPVSECAHEHRLQELQMWTLVYVILRIFTLFNLEPRSSGSLQAWMITILIDRKIQ